MSADGDFEIFIVTSPGFESVLCAEVLAKGFRAPVPVKGGVTIKGGWPEVRRANLELRGAGRVLARIGEFRAFHLAQLDKRAHKFPWGEILRPDVPFRVEVSCTGSRIYHQGAAAQRIAKAIGDTLGAPLSPNGARGEAEVCVKARIEDDLCTISVDTSGESLHKRGHKEAVAKAPMRETLASLFLRQCGYGGGEPVLDPMCGSGTFVIEAAEIAAGLNPGRSRHFAFERLANFDAAAWRRQRGPEEGPVEDDSAENSPGDAQSDPRAKRIRFYGSDRDAGAIGMSRANAARAGVAGMTEFRQRGIDDLVAPDGPPGLVIVNPPYGTRIGEKKRLYPLYYALGRTLLTRFAGWRVGLVASDAWLAGATGLPFASPTGPGSGPGSGPGPGFGSVSHGGLRVTLHLTGPLD